MIPWILKFMGLLVVGIPAAIALSVFLAHVLAIVAAPAIICGCFYGAWLAVSYRLRNGHWYDPSNDKQEWGEL